MDTIIIRIILTLITLFLAAVLVYIVRQDLEQKRALTLDVDALPEPVYASDTAAINDISKNGKNYQKNKKKR